MATPHRLESARQLRALPAWSFTCERWRLLGELESLLGRPLDDARCTRPKCLKVEIAVVDATVRGYEQRDRRRLEVRCQSNPQPTVPEANENQLIVLGPTFPLRRMAVAGLKNAQDVYGQGEVGVDLRVLRGPVQRLIAGDHSCVPVALLALCRASKKTMSWQSQPIARQSRRQCHVSSPRTGGTEVSP